MISLIEKTTDSLLCKWRDVLYHVLGELFFLYDFL